MKREWDFATRKKYEEYLRIYFAGLAMQGLVMKVTGVTLTKIANDAVQCANALIEALNKETPDAD